MIDESTKAVLNKAEGILKDRFTAYLIVAIDGDKSYRCWSSDIFAMGSAHMVIEDLKNKWQERGDD